MFMSLKLTLLYIDNDQQDREDNALFIRNHGIHVLTASNTSMANELY